mmetsp:Transcript_45938/g.141964  ORF Transcript_45938/g.141964 Transcript_45938/m.141964 type:complete len:270 (+) Transcript_45938:526-1335(+)
MSTQHGLKGLLKDEIGRLTHRGIISPLGGRVRGERRLRTCFCLPRDVTGTLDQARARAADALNDVLVPFRSQPPARGLRWQRRRRRARRRPRHRSWRGCRHSQGSGSLADAHGRGGDVNDVLWFVLLRRTPLRLAQLPVSSDRGFWRQWCRSSHGHVRDVAIEHVLRRIGRGDDMLRLLVRVLVNERCSPLECLPGRWAREAQQYVQLVVELNCSGDCLHTVLQVWRAREVVEPDSAGGALAAPQPSTVGLALSDAEDVLDIQRQEPLA